MKRTISLLALAGLTLSAPALAQSYPAPTDNPDKSEWGRHIQRTMSLLESSTAENPNTVRILFYGQSITDHKQWVRDVVASLEDQYPTANIVWENRAVGGWASQVLEDAMWHDVVPFYPDLMIFHVYGSHTAYESVLRETRKHTAAEVAIWTDHLNGNSEKVGNDWAMDDWSEQMDVFIRDFANKYDCEIIDVHNAWGHYLNANDLQPSDLLQDNVHCNDHGYWLIGQLVERQLIHREEFPDDPEGLFTEIPASEFQQEEGDIIIPFNGNRIDVVLAEGSGSYTARIDEAAPSSYPGVYSYDRPRPYAWSGQDTVYHVGTETPDTMLLLEDWTLTVTEVLAGDVWVYEVEGSQTGADGTGRSDQDFVSDSGRVTIASDNWYGPNEASQFIEVGDTVTWSGHGHFTDTVEYSGSGEEQIVTVAQGVSNARHVLVLSPDGENAPEVVAAQVYRPAVDREEVFFVDIEELAFPATGELSTTVNLTAEGEWQAENVPAWLTVTPASGDGDTEVTIEAAANTSDARSADVDFVSEGGTEFAVTISQAEGEAPERESFFTGTEEYKESSLGWVYDGFYPWVYQWGAFEDWVYIHNDDRTGYFFYRWSSESWAWANEDWTGWYYEMGSEAGWQRFERE